ncbi:MAG: hypothetical protein VZR11_05105 [Succinimonas sp.]|jgi:hypothetical protein|nr:hypothetical protein [Succinimonas sp.]
MRIFDWVPNTSVGDLVFGMNREDCRKIMDSEYTSMNGDYSDFYVKLLVRLDYDSDNLLESVEFCGCAKECYDVRYNGITIYPLTKRQFFKVMDKSVFVQDDYGAYINYELNITIGWDEDVDTLLIGKLNSMRDADIWLKEADELKDLFALLKKGMEREESRKILAKYQRKLAQNGSTDSYDEYLHITFDERNLLESAKVEYRGTTFRKLS